MPIPDREINVAIRSAMRRRRIVLGHVTEGPEQHETPISKWGCPSFDISQKTTKLQNWDVPIAIWSYGQIGD
jgi:hypothetical protein